MPRFVPIPPTHRRQSRRGISFVDVIVVLVLVALLIALWTPTISKTRERARRQQCVNNLRMIAGALAAYRQINSGQNPRTRYVPSAKPDVSGGGADAPDPFGPGGPPPNNVPAALFLLVRTQDVGPPNLVCPSAGGRFARDDFGGFDEQGRSNFSDVRRNLGYSFFNPYTEAPGGQQGMPVAADLNPGRPAAVGPVAAADLTADPRRYRSANSNNHGKAGQFVLYDDYTVIWYTTPFAGLMSGAFPDNVYTTRKNTIVDAPVDAQDTILLPADE